MNTDTSVFCPAASDGLVSTLKQGTIPDTSAVTERELSIIKPTCCKSFFRNVTKINYSGQKRIKGITYLVNLFPGFFVYYGGRTASTKCYTVLGVDFCFPNRVETINISWTGRVFGGGPGTACPNGSQNINDYDKNNQAWSVQQNEWFVYEYITIDCFNGEHVINNSIGVSTGVCKSNC